MLHSTPLLFSLGIKSTFSKRISPRIPCTHLRRVYKQRPEQSTQKTRCPHAYQPYAQSPHLPNASRYPTMMSATPRITIHSRSGTHQTISRIPAAINTIPHIRATSIAQQRLSCFTGHPSTQRTRSPPRFHSYARRLGQIHARSVQAASIKQKTEARRLPFFFILI